MGRPERPVDPSAGPIQLLAYELRKLRRTARLTYRQLAVRSGCSVTALSEAAGGERLPTLRVTLMYAEACGGDPGDWERRWRAAAAETAGAEQEEADPPYRGLATYEAENADRFFGRDRLVGELVDRLRRSPFLGVFGPSGSGKSSLLRAGLVPAVREGRLSPDGRHREAVVLTPGAHPLQRLPDLSGDTLGLVVVDQFEEVFTLCRDAAERSRFIDALVSAQGTGVALGVRADFYGRCAEHRALIEVLGDASLLVGPMSAEELREAIVKPASRDGLTVEPALVATIVRDAGDEPGSLPHVSHALLETWRQRRGKALTTTGYEGSGGVHGAIARTAERVYTEFSPGRREVARRILLRLVALGEGGEDTRRRVDRAELDFDAPAEVGAVLERLARDRLITLGEGTVEVAHEALIDSWPRLRDWLGEDREGLRIHRRVTEAAMAWEELGRDPSGLLHGTRLATAREWAARDGNDAHLTVAERAFLEAGIAGEAAELAAAERRNRRLRGLAFALSALLVASLATGLVAWGQRQSAVHQRQTAQSRQRAAEALAVAETDVRGSARLALQAYRSAPTEEARSSLLSIAGHQRYSFRLTGHVGAAATVAFSPDGAVLASGGRDKSVILWDVVRNARLTTLTGHRDPVQSVAFSPDGRLIASGDTGGTVILWDVARRTPMRTLTGRGGQPVTGLGFSGDGERLAALDVMDTQYVWAVTTGKRSRRYERKLGQEGAVLRPYGAYPGFRARALLAFGGRVPPDEDAGVSVPSAHAPDDRPSDVRNEVMAVSPDARLFAEAGFAPESMWAESQRIYGDHALDFSGAPGQIRAMAFTPDGRALISGDSSGATVVWDVRHQARMATLTGHAGAVNDVGIGPDGRLVASAGDDGIVVWNMNQMPLTGHVAAVTSVAYSPDGRVVATGAADETTRLWTSTNQGLLGTLITRKAMFGEMVTVDTGRVNTVAFSPDGRVLATGETGAGRLWDVATRRRTGTLRVRDGLVTSVMFDPSGQLLATGVSDGQVLLWDAATHRRTASLRAGGAVNSLAFSPDGRLLAVGGNSETVSLFTVAGHVAAGSLPGRSGEIKQVAFSPDGRLLAAATDSGDVLLWDVRRRVLIATLRGHASSADAVAFSRDGRLLASGGLDHNVVVWDVASRTRWATLTGHVGPVTGVAFSPDGATLASASADHTVIPWGLRPEAALKRLCALAGREAGTSAAPCA